MNQNYVYINYGMNSNSNQIGITLKQFDNF